MLHGLKSSWKGIRSDQIVKGVKKTVLTVVVGVPPKSLGLCTKDTAFIDDLGPGHFQQALLPMTPPIARVTHPAPGNFWVTVKGCGDLIDGD
jgi:hypothetical protein